MRKILSYLIIISVIFSCKKDVPNTGIIIREVKEINCLGFIKDSSFVIQSDAEYNMYKAQNTLCQNFPEIDFNQYALMAQKYGVGCNDIVYAQVNDLASSKVYEYKLLICEKRCRNKSLKTDLVFVLVPKLPSGYSVVYSKEKI
jgi:hypothetical protein